LNVKSVSEKGKGPYKKKRFTQRKYVEEWGVCKHRNKSHNLGMLSNLVQTDVTGRI